MINITSQSTQEQITEICHSATAVPSLIILWISFAIVSLFSAWAFKGQNVNWGRFFWYWFMTIAITGVILLWLIYSPHTIQFIVDKFVS